MNAQLSQEQFSHGRCQNCNHAGLIDRFSPELVNLEDSNHPFVKFNIEEPPDILQVRTVNYTCPICGSHAVEPFYPTEMN